MTPAVPCIATVLVTYNRLSMLQKSLPLLLAENAGRIVVVDNASTDDTAAWLARQDDPRLTVLTLPENSGGAGGFEAGMIWLVNAEEPDWILLLDDDAWPEEKALQTFARTVPSLPAATGAVVAAVRLPNGQIAEMNRPGSNPFWHLHKIWSTLTRGSRAGFKLPDSAYAADAPLAEIDNGSFVGYFVSRAGWQQVGLPEAGLFIYGDDVLYSLRLRRAGLKIIFAPALRFSHDCGSMDAHFVYRPLWKIYYHCRNGVAIARAAAGPLVFPLALVWYILVWSRRGRRCPQPERTLYWRMMWTGIRDGLMGRRGRVDRIHQMSALAKDLDGS